MKTRTKIGTLLIGMSILMGACQDDMNDKTIVPSSSVSKEDRSLNSTYSGLEVSTAFTVYVQFSSMEESIEIEANSNLHQYIEVEKAGDNLRIKLKDNINIRGSATFIAHVTTKTPLEYFVGSEASHIVLNNELNAQNISLSLSGASHFSGSIHTNNLTTFLSEASNATLEGSADSYSIIASGASLLKDYGMIAQDVNSDLSGASHSSLTVNGNIDLKASEASVFRYKGTAAVNSQNLSGASQIVKVD